MSNAVRSRGDIVARLRGVVPLVDQGIVSATNFLTTVLIGRFAGTEELGLYMLGMTVALFATSIQDSIVSTPYMVYSPELSGQGLRAFTGSSVLQQLMLAGLASLAVLGAASLFATDAARTKLGYTFVLLAPALFGMLARNHLRSIEYSRRRPYGALALDATVAAISMPALIYLGVAGRLTARWAFGTVAVATGLGLLAWLIVRRPALRTAGRRLLPDLAKSWKLGKWVLASGAVWALTTYSYPWLLTYFHGADAAGLWAACLGVLAFANVPVTGVQNTIGPKLAALKAEGGPNALPKQAHRYAMGLGISIGLAALLYLGFGERLIVWIYGPEFGGSGAAVFLLAARLAVTAAAFSYSRSLLVLSRADLEFAINVILVVVLAVVGIPLTRSLGVLGAAYALLGGSVLVTIVRIPLFLRLSARNAAT